MVAVERMVFVGMARRLLRVVGVVSPMQTRWATPATGAETRSLRNDGNGEITSRRSRPAGEIASIDSPTCAQSRTRLLSTARTLRPGPESHSFMFFS